MADRESSLAGLDEHGRGERVPVGAARGEAGIEAGGLACDEEHAVVRAGTVRFPARLEMPLRYPMARDGRIEAGLPEVRRRFGADDDLVALATVVGLEDPLFPLGREARARQGLEAQCQRQIAAESLAARG